MAYLTKILVFLLAMSVLDVVREAFSLGKALVNPRGEYRLGKWRILLLFLSLSYLATIIFTGF